MRRLLLIGFIITLAGSLLGVSARYEPPVSAQQGPTATPTPGGPPSRELELTIDYTAHEWWLARWSDNEVLCYFWVDHEGLPTDDDVSSYCPANIASQWTATDPCIIEEGDSPEECRGLYLLPVGEHAAKRKVPVELGKPKVWLNLQGCSLETPRNICASLPNLLLTAEEPLPNESIISIEGLIDGRPFVCQGDQCRLPMQPTGPGGAKIVFWANSSYGDKSEDQEALVRVVPRGDFMDPDGKSAKEAPSWFTDIVSDQWRGVNSASCAETWRAMPKEGGSEPWLQTPNIAADLYSDLSLYHLAGVLITNGLADASQCLNNGLAGEMLASECGKDAAREEVNRWQNQFDAEIYQTAQDTGVPAQLLKNVFSRESQLWPGIYNNLGEAGFGQLTSLGADTFLLWNPSFYDQFCPLVLHENTCDKGFGNLTPEAQAMLRGALVSKVNAACPDCPQGVDLTQAGFSVHIFAEGMKANCRQVGRIVSGVTGYTPGEVADYEDLWRFTLANYNAGSGCLTDAIDAVWSSGKALEWDAVSVNLLGTCQNASDYVFDISKTLGGVTPTPTSWVYPGQTVQAITPSGAGRATATPRFATTAQPTATQLPTFGPTATPGPTSTPGPSPTPGGGYPVPTSPGGYPVPTSLPGY